jgi:ABC-type branched-subunit amino acid transport system permease subunit
MLYGLSLVLVISFLPNGLMGWLRSRRPGAERAA